MERETFVMDVPSKSRVYIYGAGRYGQRVLEFLSKNRKDIEVLGFIDTYRNGTVKGKRILSLSEFKKERPKCDLVIIASSAFYEEMEEAVRDLGYEFVTPARYGVSVSKEELKKIETIERMLIAGKETYRLVIDAHINGNKERIKKYHREKGNREYQYFDYVNFKRVKIAIDGGLFDGTTATKMLKKIGADGVIFGFDPWGTKFLKPEVKNKRIQIVPMALWSRKASIYFYTGYSNNFAGTAFVSK